MWVKELSTITINVFYTNFFTINSFEGGLFNNFIT